jgi:hypothetical protein
MQYTLLFLEVIILGVTIYFFWLTRQSAAAVNRQAQAGSHSGKPDTAGMVRELTDLVSELQAAAYATQTDLARQKVEVQQVVNRAEIMVTELHSLLKQAEIVPPRFTPFTFGETAESDAGQPKRIIASAETAETLGQALLDFGGYLAQNGRSQSSASRTLGYVRHFLQWLNGQRYEDAPLSKIDPLEIEAYHNHLGGHNVSSQTVKRKITAIRQFTDWVTLERDDALPPDNAPAGRPKPPVHKIHGQLEQPVPSAGGAGGANRYKTVYALAEQGLDHPAIAARTGLEQEAVRMLLLVRAQSQLKH